MTAAGLKAENAELRDHIKKLEAQLEAYVVDFEQHGEAIRAEQQCTSQAHEALREAQREAADLRAQLRKADEIQRSTFEIAAVIAGSLAKTLESDRTGR